MRNLLSIEEAFLNLPQVKQAISLTEIRSIQRQMLNGKKKKFEQSLQVAKLVKATADWFGSDAGKKICAEEGIEWTAEDIANKIFGWQKSYYYKMLKAAKVEESVVNVFKTKCDEAEANGDDSIRSIENLLKYAKNVTANVQQATETAEDGEEVDVEEIAAETSVETEREEITFELRCVLTDSVVKMTYNKKEIKTSNTINELEQAEMILQALISMKRQREYSDNNNNNNN